MTEETDKAYLKGKRRSYVEILNMCLQELGYGKLEDLNSVMLIQEREDAIATLRTICEIMGIMTGLMIFILAISLNTM